MREEWTLRKLPGCWGPRPLYVGVRGALSHGPELTPDHSTPSHPDAAGPTSPCPPLVLWQVCLLLVLLGGADGFGGLKTLSNENAFLNAPNYYDRLDAAAGAYEMPARRHVEKKAAPTPFSMTAIGLGLRDFPAVLGPALSGTNHGGLE